MDQHSNQCISISFITGDFKLLEVFVTLPAMRTGFTEQCKRSRISLTAASRELKSLTYESAVGLFKYVTFIICTIVTISS